MTDDELVSLSGHLLRRDILPVHKLGFALDSLTQDVTHNESSLLYYEQGAQGATGKIK